MKTMVYEQDELVDIAKEYRRAAERVTKWDIRGVKLSFANAGEPVLTLEAPGWSAGTEADDHVRFVSESAQKALDGFGILQRDFKRRYGGVEFELAGGSYLGTKVAGEDNMDRTAARPGRLVVTLEAKSNPDFDAGSWSGSVNIPLRRELVDGMEDAARTCRRFIEENDLGGGNWTGGDVYDEDMNLVAKVSYNGRVWEPGRHPTREIDARAWDKARELEFRSRRSSEFSSQDELDKYLREHPRADKSKHKVRKTVWDSLTPAQRIHWNSQDRQNAKEMAERNRFAATGKAAPKGMYSVRLSASPNADYTSPDERLRTYRTDDFFVAVKDFDEAADVCRKFQKGHRIGYGNWDGGQVYDDKGEQVAQVAYGGMVRTDKMHFLRAARIATIAARMCVGKTHPVVLDVDVQNRRLWKDIEDVAENMFDMADEDEEGERTASLVKSKARELAGKYIGYSSGTRKELEDSIEEYIWEEYHQQG